MISSHLNTQELLYRLTLEFGGTCTATPGICISPTLHQAENATW